MGVLMWVCSVLGVLWSLASLSSLMEMVSARRDATGLLVQSVMVVWSVAATALFVRVALGGMP